VLVPSNAVLALVLALVIESPTEAGAIDSRRR